jgi:signal transduction histidine kinase
VVVLGALAALVIGLATASFLSRSSEVRAHGQAKVLAVAVAARIHTMSPDARAKALKLAARRTSAELLLVSEAGAVVQDETLGLPESASLLRMLEQGEGVADVRTGRAHFYVASVPALEGTPSWRLIVLVPVTGTTRSVTTFGFALAALVVLLLGIAASVAHAVAHDVAREVAFVTDKVKGIAHLRDVPSGEPVPVRTVDALGALAVGFNRLLGRFAIASEAYREDRERAAAADRERSAFLAALSHELRSPLNAILGFADVLTAEVDGPLSASAKDDVAQIRESGAHLLSLINDILELSALESGELRLVRERVDVSAVAHDVVREARGLVERKALRLAVEGQSVVARVDARRIRQILSNLVSNAIKFTSKGEVVVSVGRVGSMVRLEVRDTGPGIPPAERTLIFEHYKQSLAETGRRRGTGLGLAITRRLVELHHGQISVESELGRGASFVVVLPIGDAVATPRKISRPRWRTS